MAGVAAPLLLAANCLAASVPYSEAVQKNPTAELTALQNEWAEHISEARQNAGYHGAPPSREHLWNPEAGSHGRFSGPPAAASTTDSSTVSNAGSTENAGSTNDNDLSSLWTRRGFDFEALAWLSNDVSQRGGAWENPWAGWPESELEDHHNLNAFRGLQTMLQDAPATFDPPTLAPEPRSAVFLLAGFFVAAVFARRVQLHRP